MSDLDSPLEDEAGGDESLECDSLSDFEDLDALLGESIEIADARKAAKNKRKGQEANPEQVALALAADLALQWKPEYAIARFIEQHCDCGASHRQFDSWFILAQHRRIPEGRKWTRSADHQDLPAWEYTAEEQVSFCSECISEEAYPRATSDLLAGIESLGIPACNCCTADELDQEQFPFMQDEDETFLSDDLLEELENANDDQPAQSRCNCLGNPCSCPQDSGNGQTPSLDNLQRTLSEGDVGAGLN